MKLIFTFELFLLITLVNGQNIQDTNYSLINAFIDPEEIPSFPGGEEALIEFIKDNMKWPLTQSTVEGIVAVRFTIDTLGNIKDLKIIKGICEESDKEALRLVSIMPRWNPRKMYGKPIEGEFTLPIKFKNEN